MKNIERKRLRAAPLEARPAMSVGALRRIAESGGDIGAEGNAQLIEARPAKLFGRPFTPETVEACTAIKRIVLADSPMTVRQVFYRLVVAGLVPKDEAKGYQKVIRWLGLMRLDKSFHNFHPELQLDWRHIVDSSREVRETGTYDDVGDRLRFAAASHRLSVLKEADTHVEVWIEKEALAEFVWQVCGQYDVPMLACPFVSHSNAYLAAQRIRDAAEEGKPTVIFHLTDYDPSGQVMTQHLTPKLNKILGGHLDLGEDDFKLTVERLALTRNQIDQHNLPTRPTKRGGNTHARNFADDESVELDALPPNVLRTMVRRAIERHVPKALVDRVRAKEAKERRKLERLAAEYAR